MKELFLALYAAFKAKEQDFIDAGLKPIAYLDLYRGQPANPKRFEFFAMPAIFFKYLINWDYGQDGSGLLTLETHSLIDPGHHTDSIGLNKESGLQLLDYYRLIDYVMRNVESDYTSKLTHQNEYPVETDFYNYQVQEYQCTIYDFYVKHPMNEGTIEDLNITSKDLKKYHI